MTVRALVSGPELILIHNEWTVNNLSDATAMQNNIMMLSDGTHH